MLSRTIAILLLPLALLSHTPEKHWRNIKCDFSSVVLPPLLRHANYRFNADFKASITNNRLTDIKIIYSPEVATKWVQEILPTLIIKAEPNTSDQTFRLKMRHLHTPQLLVRKQP